MHISESITTYKLLILYMINVIDYPLSNAQISDFILGRGYTDYFNVQQAISDLLDTNMIMSTKVQNSTRYTLTEDGIQTIDILANQIPSAIREDARIYLKEHNFSIRETNSIYVNYEILDNDECLVHLKVDENHIPLIELNMSIASEDAAKKMCDNWKECSQDIYSYILTTLINHTERHNNNEDKKS